LFSLLFTSCSSCSFFASPFSRIHQVKEHYEDSNGGLVALYDKERKEKPVRYLFIFTIYSLRLFMIDPFDDTYYFFFFFPISSFIKYF
jgi:hypothetical protein